MLRIFPEKISKKIFSRTTLYGALIVCGALVIIGGIGVLWLIRDLPSPELLDSYQVAESTKLYDRTGETLLYEVFKDERRTIIPFEEIPLYARQATLAIEDQTFYSHPAVDIKAIFRAILANLKHGWGEEGGSTITQQLARNAFLSTEKTLTRKIRELFLAFRLENKFTKDQILYMYLNQIPYGSNAYGIESASRYYFRKSAKDLNLAEAATLAAMIQAPSYYSPWGNHVDELLARKNLVLHNMEKLGFITEEEQTAAAATELVFEKPASSILAPHFSIAVQEYLNEKYGEEFVRRAGLRVITTLDWDMQELAEKVVKEGAERNENLYKGTNAALVAEDPKTGQLLALVGSRDYFDIERGGNFNVATQGLRQPGSAMKPFVYMTAFTKGLTPDTVVFDLHTEFDASGRQSYSPENFDHEFRGPVSLRNALAQSINVPAVKVLYLSGIDAVLAMMKKFGVTTLTERSRYGLSLVLGGGEVTLAQMVGAYSTLSQEGVFHPQTMILKITDKDGRVLEEYKDQSEQAVEPEYPRMINDILSDAEARHALFQASYGLTVFPGYDVALKTGTTNDYRDAWAFGYTPTLAIGVWAGNNDNTPMIRSGGSILAAIPMWNAFLKEALKEQPAETFTRPEIPTPNKPILTGSYIVNYTANGQVYPQVHNILFYVNKSDPLGSEPRRAVDSQFNNWEGPVLSWASAHVPGFIPGATYNLPIPAGATASGSSSGSTGQTLPVQLVAPANGSTITGSTIVTQAQITLSKEIQKIEVFFNGALVDSRVGFFGTAYTYQATLTPPILNAQNLLKVVATDKDGASFEAQAILYH